MSYILGDITLPRPKEFIRDFIKTGQRLKMLDGTTKEDIISKKEQFTLVFRRLTQDQVDEILTEYNKDTAVSFSVSETNLTVNATNVLISIAGRQYLKGGEYREDMTLVLEEVS